MEGQFGKQEGWVDGGRVRRRDEVALEGWFRLGRESRSARLYTTRNLTLRTSSTFDNQSRNALLPKRCGPCWRGISATHPRICRKKLDSC